MPTTRASRPPSADAKSWDKPLVAAAAMIGPVVLLLLCGLDHRVRWSAPTPAWAQAGGLFSVAAGGMLTNGAVLAVRTALEDRTRQAELGGDADYARRVRFRLVPGVW